MNFIPKIYPTHFGIVYSADKIFLNNACGAIS